METRIMIVDNWPYSLECIRWLVKDEPYRCFGYSDTAKALEMLGGTEFAVVLAEQSMPQISGIDHVAVL